MAFFHIVDVGLLSSPFLCSRHVHVFTLMGIIITIMPISAEVQILGAMRMRVTVN